METNSENRDAYEAVYNYYRYAPISGRVSCPDYRKKIQALIDNLPDPDVVTDLEIDAVMCEVISGLLEWGSYNEDENKIEMRDYAKVALEDNVHYRTCLSKQQPFPLREFLSEENKEEDPYKAVYNYYRNNPIPKQVSCPDYRKKSQDLIDNLPDPDVVTNLEIAAVMWEIRMSYLEWGYHKDDGKHKMSVYAYVELRNDAARHGADYATRLSKQQPFPLGKFLREDNIVFSKSTNVKFCRNKTLNLIQENKKNKPQSVSSFLEDLLGV